MSLKTYLLSSDKPKVGYFGELDIPKCLLTLKDNRTILDYQYSVLKNFPLDIRVVIGYEGDKVVDLCRERGYDIDFVWDRTWRKKYSTSRIILDNPEFDGPLMIIFGDALFKPMSIKWVLHQNADINIAHLSIIRFTTKGLIEAKKILARRPELIGFGTRLFRDMETAGCTVSRFDGPLWNRDVDRYEELKIARDWAKNRKF